MKVCVTITGVCRPSYERVKENIESNIAYFTTNYPQHSFTYVLLSYKNKYTNELSDFCKGKGITSLFIDCPEDKDFIFPVKFSHPNVYRLFYSMSYILSTIPKNTYDCIIRLRIDAEVRGFELPSHISENVFYCLDENDSGRCSSNVGYGSCKVMRTIWRHENCMVKGVGEECVVFNTVQKYNYKIQPFKYHILLHQSDDKMYDGVAQWSRRSREWIYDGKQYLRNDIPTQV